MGTYFSLSLLLRVQLFRAPAVCGVFQLDLALGLTLSHPPFPTSLQGSADMDPGDARDLLTGMVHSVSGTCRMLTATPLPSHILFQARGFLLLFRPTHLTPTGATGALLCPFRGGLLTTPSTRWQPSPTCFRPLLSTMSTSAVVCFWPRRQS